MTDLERSSRAVRTNSGRDGVDSGYAAGAEGHMLGGLKF